jgi:hypothetical protein
VNADLHLEKLLPASWGVDLPLSITHASSAQDPSFLAQATWLRAAGWTARDRLRRDPGGRPPAQAHPFGQSAARAAPGRYHAARGLQQRHQQCHHRPERNGWAGRGAELPPRPGRAHHRRGARFPGVGAARVRARPARELGRVPAPAGLALPLDPRPAHPRQRLCHPAESRLALRPDPGPAG